MSVPIATAERVLRSRFGTPAKTPTDYVIGFKTAQGRVLALHRTLAETTLWFESPAPPEMDGVQLIGYAKKSNLNGALAPLASVSTLRAEIATEGALIRFLEWYAASAKGAPFPANFNTLFQRFQQLVTARSKGHPFTNFQERLAASWEDSKPKLRAYALTRLASNTWSEATIGSGTIFVM